MTEKELLELGFVKEFSLGTIDDQPEYYYYTKDFTDGLSFISNASDELDGEWFVEFFNTEIPVRYYEPEKVKLLFRLIEYGLTEK
jgi:hypothetical protein